MWHLTLPFVISTWGTHLACEVVNSWPTVQLQHSLIVVYSSNYH